MVNAKLIDRLKKVPIEERIQLIETLLESLKADLNIQVKGKVSNANTFKVRKFRLGQEVHMDRNELYEEKF